MTTKTRTGRVLRSFLAAAIATTGLAAAVIAAAPAASASTPSGTVVYSANQSIPAPPSSNFAGSSGGDGWALAMTPTAVYNVFHHQGTLQVACHLQTDASQCWAPETITDGSGNNFATSGMPGLWIDQATGHLFVYADRQPDNTAGVVCIDTTVASTNPNPFCGFTALSAAGDAPFDNSGFSGITNPVVVNNKWYAFNYVRGIPTGTKDQLLCFDLSTLGACATPAYPVTLGLSPNIQDVSPSPGIAAVGTDVIVPVNQSLGAYELACFDTLTGGNCSGSWPADTTSISYPSAQNGTPFPMLSASGVATGVCLPTGLSNCYNLDGSVATAPAGMASAITENFSWDGPSVTIGARVYIPNGVTEQVQCFDYSSGASCTNFPKALSSLTSLYTVNADPQRPSCLWVNADAGVSQIQNFDAYTGGPCGQGPVRVVAASIVAPSDACIPANYTSLQVTTPTPSQYTSGSVQFEDFNGNPIASIPDQPLDSNGAVNLAPLNLTTKTPLPQFLITLNGAGSPPEVDVTLKWTGTYDPSCASGGQQVTGQGYRLGGRDGGVFTFGQSGFYGSMAGKHLNGPEVGIAATADNKGYWLAASDGGVFAFGDATFLGSMGNKHLNKPIVGLAAATTGEGYYLVASDGGVFNYGSATFHGSLGAGGATAPIVGIAPTPTGNGYWLVGSDGNVYAFGDAANHGSEAGKSLAAPIVGIVSSHDGLGYELVGSDGGVFSFGDAPFLGSRVGKPMTGPAVGMVMSPSGNGYWLDASDGGVFAFGDAQFLGCMVGRPLAAPLDSISN